MRMTSILLTTLACVFVGVLEGAQRSAEACSFAALPQHEVDPGSTDTEPPTAPDVQAVHIRRGNDCPGANSCADLGFIDIELVPGTDDETDIDRLGYRLEVLSGGLPGDDFLPDYDFRMIGDTLVLIWIDGATNQQEAFSATLRLSAIDAAGNQSESIAIDIEHDGSVTCDGALGEMTGCAVSAHGDSRGLLGAILMLGVVIALRRRRLDSHVATLLSQPPPGERGG